LVGGKAVGAVAAAAAGGEAVAATGVYKPPKLNPVAMDEDMELNKQERRRLKEATRKARRRWVGGGGGNQGCLGVLGLGIGNRGLVFSYQVCHGMYALLYLS
jgi:hypothetical protein